MPLHVPLLLDTWKFINVIPGKNDTRPPSFPSFILSLSLPSFFPFSFFFFLLKYTKDRLYSDIANL